MDENKEIMRDKTCLSVLEAIIMKESDELG
jgi:hypothetical protein